MSQKKSTSTSTPRTRTSSGSPGAKKKPQLHSWQRDALIRIESYLAAERRESESARIALHRRCAELATHVRRLTDEKAQLAAALRKKDQELDDFRQSINKGLEREENLRGRLIGVLAMKMENIDLADPRLPIPTALIDFGQHSLRALEKRVNG